MKVMSLFAGIGGFDLAADKMGWETTVQVELDEWCRKVLAKNFPNAYRHDDIKTFDGTPFAGSIDLICGGFPCQPYSSAGKRLGKADIRHLWPYMFRTIQQVKPRWVVGENVRGFINWNGGLVFKEVLADLESAGYQVQPFLIPAAGVNAPHPRYRVWIVAYRDDRFDQSKEEEIQAGRLAFESGSESTFTNSNCSRQSQQKGSIEDIRGWAINSNKESFANTQCEGFQRCPFPQQQPEVFQLERFSPFASNSQCIGWKDGIHGCTSGPRKTSEYRDCSSEQFFSDWPTQSPLCAGNDGIPSRLVRSARFRALARWRNQTIKAAGNAVVWQVVYQIFKAIEQMESTEL